MQSATVAHVATAVATGFLVVVGVWGVWETKKALELSQRAWLSPIDAQLVIPLEIGKPIHFRLILQNTGREPARDVHFHLLNSTIEAYDPVTVSMNNITVPDNTSCDGIRPEQGRYNILRHLHSILPMYTILILYMENHH
jgi:hypothetical protein